MWGGYLVFPKMLGDPGTKHFAELPWEVGDECRKGMGWGGGVYPSDLGVGEMWEGSSSFLGCLCLAVGCLDWLSEGLWSRETLGWTRLPSRVPAQVWLVSCVLAVVLWPFILCGHSSSREAGGGVGHGLEEKNTTFEWKDVVLKVHDGTCRRHGPSYQPSWPRALGLSGNRTWAAVCSGAQQRWGSQWPVGAEGSPLSWPHLVSAGAASSGPLTLLSCSSPDSHHFLRCLPAKAAWAEGTLRSFSGSKWEPAL